MRVEIDPDDWMTLDSWWSAHTQAWPTMRHAGSVHTLDSTRVADSWLKLDPWWRAHTNSTPHVRGAASSRALLGEQLANSWSDLDSWWDAYTKIGHETAVEIAKLLKESNKVWQQSVSPFDTDPLTVAVTQNEGPLLPNTEEDWSDWLAKLLRPSAALVAELFDVAVEGAPDKIIREDQLSKDEDGFRRPDLLLFHTNQGISIEVKLGDEHYGKTEETARLIESEYDDYEWHHTLLLPERKTERLRAIVSPAVSSRHPGGLQVDWEDLGPIVVVYWRDVTAAIRTVLRRGDIVSDHWAANAYLFCAAVEQLIFHFQPQPVIEQMADPRNIADTVRPISFADALDEQHAYLSNQKHP